MKRYIWTAAIAALAIPASAQLIIGNDDTAAGPNAWHIDVSNGNATALWNDHEVWGAAADNANGRLYVNDGSALGVWNFGAVGTEPTSLGTIMVGTTTLSFVGLAWANGKLYGTRNISPEDIYEIDVNTLQATSVYSYTAADYDFGGFSYDDSTGLFYGTSDDSSPGPRGLYSIDVFGAGGINLVVAYPAGETDIDGLAVGGGKAYFVEDEPATTSDSIHVYNLITNSWEAPLPTPMPTSEVFSGGAWAPNALVPEPASLAVLGLGALALLRRKKK